MMPHQSQGACMAIEDAAALGIIFSDKYDFTNDIEAGLALYQIIREPRSTRVQEASWRATLNINERIGFTSLTAPEAELAAAADKLTSEPQFFIQQAFLNVRTVNEMNSYKMHDHVATEVAKLSAPAQV